jgi:hypothetical protein
MPSASSLLITGLISLSVRTRSPIIIALSPIGSKAIQPPRAKLGLRFTPSSETLRSLRGSP